jgi:hypothetical protein
MFLGELGEIKSAASAAIFSCLPSDVQFVPSETVVICSLRRKETFRLVSPLVLDSFLILWHKRHLKLIVDM